MQLQRREWDVNHGHGGYQQRATDSLTSSCCVYILINLDTIFTILAKKLKQMEKMASWGAAFTFVSYSIVVHWTDTLATVPFAVSVQSQSIKMHDKRGTFYLLYLSYRYGPVDMDIMNLSIWTSWLFRATFFPLFCTIFYLLINVTIWNLSVHIPINYKLTLSKILILTSSLVSFIFSLFFLFRFNFNCCLKNLKTIKKKHGISLASASILSGERLWRFSIKSSRDPGPLVQVPMI